MARTPKPWRRRSSGGAWYAQIAGQQVRLADADASFRDAQTELVRILAGVDHDTAETGSVGDVIAQFLEDAQSRVARGELTHHTANQYMRRLDSFADAAGDLRVDQIRAKDVKAWLAKHPTWGTTTRAGCITAVKVAFNWAVAEGIIGANPVAHMRAAAAIKPHDIPAAAVLAQSLAACGSQEFLLFLRVLYQTGCRRSEAMIVEAQDIDWERGLWARAGKTTRVTRKPRIVHVPTALLDVLREEAKRWPRGPLLRNTAGNPWTESGLSSQMRRLRDRLRQQAAKEAKEQRLSKPDAERYIADATSGLTFRSLRHLFTTDALAKGVPIATVAELLGHSTTALISQRYGHLEKRPEHLKQALAQVRPSTPPLDAQSDPASAQPVRRAASRRPPALRPLSDAASKPPGRGRRKRT